MRNTKNYKIKTCIYMTLNEYGELILNLTDNLQMVVYNTEENYIFYDATDESINTETIWIEDINETLSKYFGAKVESVHIDNEGPIGVWICVEE